jgi:hypothetical protein
VTAPIFPRHAVIAEAGREEKVHAHARIRSEGRIAVPPVGIALPDRAAVRIRMAGTPLASLLDVAGGCNRLVARSAAALALGSGLILRRGLGLRSRLALRSALGGGLGLRSGVALRSALALGSGLGLRSGLALRSALALGSGLGLRSGLALRSALILRSGLRLRSGLVLRSTLTTTPRLIRRWLIRRALVLLVGCSGWALILLSQTDGRKGD